MEVEEGAAVRAYLTERSTMIILGPALAILGIGFLCWLVFTLAVYALPFFVGLTAGMAAYHSGAGVLGGIVVGFVVGAVTLGLGQFAFASIPSALVRAAIALLFAVPAAIAGYHATLGLAHIAVPSATWREIFSVAGAICIGCTAFIRMAAMALPPALGPATSPEPTQPRLTGATGQG